eukprot:TRINITY_DN27183_c0_g2_i1.p1 TRINITY_DN27183_c0_g2~~TRINITY_DN27183_c0_g2_i1.p1  ORF type:complete len:320 (-),score=42.73 TRINITY_DN27183_c0_g2_i1:39-998(-)
MGAKSSACAECKEMCSQCLSFALCSEADLKEGSNVFKVDPRMFCKTCMLKHTNIDFKQTEDVIEAKGDVKGNILFVHGGGGNRLMFAAHARALASLGFRCVLLDLPGHASRIDEPLSMDSACACVKAVHEIYFGSSALKCLYVGGSLGAYIGMEFLGRHPSLFSGAVIGMAGQDVGSETRGWKAGLGIFAMKNFLPGMAPTKLFKLMRDQCAKNGHISPDLYVEMVARPGFFFHQVCNQIAVMEASAPRKSLGNFLGPILFVNGDQDHHDSDHVWLALCSHNASKLVLYEGADHFFSHDERFMQRFIDDLAQFAALVVG